MALTQTRWMSALLMGFAAFTFGLPSAKADCNKAIVTHIVAGPGYCGGYGGFETVDSPRGICLQSDAQMRLVMAALMSGRPIAFQFTSGDGTKACTNEGSNWTKTAKYITLL